MTFQDLLHYTADAETQQKLFISPQVFSLFPDSVRLYPSLGPHVITTDGKIIRLMA